jgi:hypothetical protein
MVLTNTYTLVFDTNAEILYTQYKYVCAFSATFVRIKNILDLHSEGVPGVRMDRTEGVSTKKQGQMCTSM